MHRQDGRQEIDRRTLLGRPPTGTALPDDDYSRSRTCCSPTPADVSRAGRWLDWRLRQLVDQRPLQGSDDDPADPTRVLQRRR